MPELTMVSVLGILHVLLVGGTLLQVSDAFGVSRVTSRRFVVRLQETNDIEQETTSSSADKFLSTKFPEFHQLLIEPSKEVSKALSDNKDCTIFAPSGAVFQNLGDKRLTQLQDPRNLETVEKMAAYHVVAEERVSWNQLFQEDWTVPKVDGKPQLSIGGVKTLGGEVTVGRSMSGGLFGSPFGAKEDGGVTVGPTAKIVKSFKVGDNCIVHEVDALVSPEILWRYCDQLRIPGF